MTNIFLCAGGTGGHLFPCESVGREIQKKGLQPILITDHRGGKHKDQFPFPVHIIYAGGLAGKSISQVSKNILMLGIGFLQSLFFCIRYRPKAAIGFGGYPSVPPLLATKLCGKKIFLHEQNAIAGRANRFLAKFCKGTFTSFKNTKFLPDIKTVYVGNPTRSDISTLRKTFKYKAKKTSLNVLVFGGSLGAKVFNDIIPKTLTGLPKTLQKQINVHQQVSDERDLQDAQKTYESSNIKASLVAFIDDMPSQLTQADLVICRAGASTVTELTTLGVPALFIPLPNSIDGHQLENAKRVRNPGGGWILEQKNFDEKMLTEKIKMLCKNKEMLQKAAKISYTLGKGHKAAAQMAKHIKENI